MRASEKVNATVENEDVSWNNVKVIMPAMIATIAPLILIITSLIVLVLVYFKKVKSMEFRLR